MTDRFLIELVHDVPIALGPVSGLINRAASRCQPVLQPQAGDVPKVPCIVRDHRQIIDKGCRPDEQVHIVDADALWPEVGS